VVARVCVYVCVFVLLLCMCVCVFVCGAVRGETGKKVVRGAAGEGLLFVCSVVYDEA
jgi:hypothetical protein